MRREILSKAVCFAVFAGAIVIATSHGAAAAAPEPLQASDNSLTERVIQIFVAVTVLSLAPGIAMMGTCLPLIVIVMSILRQGLGLQQAPPNMLIMALSIFLTYFVMEPIFKESWSAGVAPLLEHQIEEADAARKAIAPFKTFMESRTSPGAVEALAAARGIAADEGAAPLSITIPAFVLSEMQRALEIGFVLLLPFLIIDLVVASVLMAMGMMMVPPTIVSLPFKLAFFVLTNGWIAVSGALVRSYH